MVRNEVVSLSQLLWQVAPSQTEPLLHPGGCDVEQRTPGSLGFANGISRSYRIGEKALDMGFCLASWGMEIETQYVHDAKERPEVSHGKRSRLYGTNDLLEFATIPRRFFRDEPSRAKS